MNKIKIKTGAFLVTSLMIGSKVLLIYFMDLVHFCLTLMGVEIVLMEMAPYTPRPQEVAIELLVLQHLITIQWLAVTQPMGFKRFIKTPHVTNETKSLYLGTTGVINIKLINYFRS